ncbi:hypothetical protein [Candidatus Lokiarchaeum ossiferum]|uniref:hypothetical protein n=1 Tax=Candidatus Lokiarchaeum ossiferum TaxID=2951803 RepID=UPI00352C04F8
MTESSNTLTTEAKKKIPSYIYCILIYLSEIVLFFILFSIESPGLFISNLGNSFGMSVIVTIVLVIAISLYRIYNMVGSESEIQMGESNDNLSLMNEDSRKAEEEYYSALEKQLKKLKEEELNLLN